MSRQHKPAPERERVMIPQKSISAHSKTTGFSLLEVLITVVIMSFGLLGIASLMIKGMGLNNASYQRSVATQQAYDMGDRIRANAAGAIAGNYNAITYSASQTCSACTSTNPCTVANLSTYDACYWNTQNETLLPMGRGTVSRDGNNFVITINWDINKDGAVNTSDTGYVLRAQL